MIKDFPDPFPFPGGYNNGYQPLPFTYTPMIQIMPPRFTTPNKRVAVEPFPPAPKAEIRGGVLAPMSQTSLTGLRVVFGSASFGEGWLLYVRTKLQGTTTYAKEVLEVDGRKFILIPEEDVVLVDNQLAPPPVVTP
jgi:hypothetical protein